MLSKIQKKDLPISSLYSLQTFNQMIDPLLSVLAYKETLNTTGTEYKVYDAIIEDVCHWVRLYSQIGLIERSVALLCLCSLECQHVRSTISLNLKRSLNYTRSSIQSSTTYCTSNYHHFASTTSHYQKNIAMDTETPQSG